MSKVSKVSLLLVASIAIVSFVLSYSNIQQLAASNGYDGFKSYLVPFLIDAAMLVFALSMMVRAVQPGESGRAWGLSILVGTYAVFSIAFNILHSNLTVIGITIAIIIPATLFFTFETAMGQVKRHVKEHGKSLTKQLDELKRHATGLQAENDKLTDAVDKLTEKNNKLAEVARPLRNEVKKLKAELKKVNEENEKLKERGVIPKWVGPFGRDILQLKGGGLTQVQVAKKHGVSESTVSRIASTFNGGVK